MFTFQVIRLTSVVVYMKWFRSKYKRHGREAQRDPAACVPVSCLCPCVLPASPGPACVPVSCLRPCVLPASPCPACSCLLLPRCRQHPLVAWGFSWLALVGSFLSLPPPRVAGPLSCQRGEDEWEGSHHPSSLLCGSAVAWGWKGAGRDPNH